MAKNIIICCDGTGNQLKASYSNVIKLFMMLDKDDQRQLCFYDPGVGTMGDPRATSKLVEALTRFGGLIFGSGLKTNVWEAYGYLMEYYEPGDKIFMFGFSRGAYTVRVIAALIHSIGLLQKGCQHLIPYAWASFRKSYKKEKRFIAAEFKRTYSRQANIHFMGVWDTVTSIGLFNRKKLPFTTSNPSLLTIRHAISIDERRTYFRQNLFNDLGDHQDVKQVWFAGVHCDIGGSYALNDSGLAQLSLEWMMDEASQAGLMTDTQKVAELLYDSAKQGYSVPDINGKIHTSLSGFWWILELLPKRRSKGLMFYFPLGRSRKMYRDSMGNPLIPVVHHSVLKKIGADYTPLNFDPKSYVLEE